MRALDVLLIRCPVRVDFEDRDVSRTIPLEHCVEREHPSFETYRRCDFFLECRLVRFEMSRVDHEFRQSHHSWLLLSSLGHRAAEQQDGQREHQMENLYSQSHTRFLR